MGFLCVVGRRAKSRRGCRPRIATPGGRVTFMSFASGGAGGRAAPAMGWRRAPHSAIAPGGGLRENPAHSVPVAVQRPASLNRANSSVSSVSGERLIRRMAITARRRAGRVAAAVCLALPALSAQAAYVVVDTGHACAGRPRRQRPGEYQYNLVLSGAVAARLTALGERVRRVAADGAEVALGQRARLAPDADFFIPSITIRCSRSTSTRVASANSRASIFVSQRNPATRKACAAPRRSARRWWRRARSRRCITPSPSPARTAAAGPPPGRASLRRAGGAQDGDHAGGAGGGRRDREPRRRGTGGAARHHRTHGARDRRWRARLPGWLARIARVRPGGWRCRAGWIKSRFKRRACEPANGQARNAAWPVWSARHRFPGRGMMRLKRN